MMSEGLSARAKTFLTPTKKNFLWMTLGNGVYSACQWGMLVVLSKLGSPEVVGQFALALAVIAPVVMITNMQLRGVQATDAKRTFYFSDYVAVRLLSTLAALAVVVMIVSWGNFDKTVVRATVMLALAKTVESLSDVFYGFFQQNEEMRFIAVSRVIKGGLSVLVLGTVFYAVSDLTTALAALWAAWTLVFAAYDCRAGRRMLVRVEGRERSALLRTVTASFAQRGPTLRRIIALAFPLGIVMGIISLNANIPRYAVEKYLSTRDLGFFAALAYTTVAINLFVQALGQAVAPRMAACFADKDIRGFFRLLKKLLVINMSIGLCGVAVIAVGGGPLLSLVYTPEYAAYTSLFLVLMLAATVMGIASGLGYALTAAREFRPQVPLFTAVLASTGLSLIWLVPKAGLYGAAGSLIVSALVQIAGSLWILRKAVNRRLADDRERKK